jgi:ankyrin repeat protein
MKNSIGLLLLAVWLVIFIPCLSAAPSLPPLVKAAQDGNLKKVEQLVERGAKINEKLSNGSTALETAAANGRLEIIEYLLSINAGDPREAFRLALMHKRIDAAKIFVDKESVDVNINASYFRTLLTDDKVPFNQRLQNVNTITNGKLNSPYILQIVQPQYYPDVIDFFNINLIDRVDTLGNTILHTAARYNNADLVKYLLDRNFNVNLLDNNNHTALFYCITSFGPSINWNNPVIEDESTAKINYISDMPYYSNPIDVKMRQAQIGNLLLEAKININQQNKSGWTVLHFANVSYPAGPKEFLIEMGANQNIRTNLGRTAADISMLRN